MSTHPSPGQSPDRFTALPQVGSATADRLATTFDLDQADVSSLALAFFGTEGRAVKEAVSDVDVLIAPLLQAGRELDDDAFGVPADTQTVLEVMAFVRAFGVSPRFLRSTSSVSGLAIDEYSISPEDIDWEQGLITDPYEVAASVYSREPARAEHHLDLYSTDTTPEYLTQNPYQWVGYHANGVRSLVGYEYVEKVSALFAIDFFEEESLEFVRVHGERDDFFVTFTDSNWVTDVALAPKVLED